MIFSMGMSNRSGSIDTSTSMYLYMDIFLAVLAPIWRNWWRVASLPAPRLPPSFNWDVERSHPSIELTRKRSMSTGIIAYKCWQTKLAPSGCFPSLERWFSNGKKEVMDVDDSNCCGSGGSETRAEGSGENIDYPSYWSCSAIAIEFIGQRRVFGHGSKRSTNAVHI